MLIDLALMFAKLCLFAFGGGYVMIAGMIQQSEARGWATAEQLTNVIAIAGISPGPVSVNAAVGYGYQVAGIPGTIAAFLGIAVTSLLVVILAAIFFFKIHEFKAVRDILYGLRPTVTGITLYAAVSIAIQNGIIAFNEENIMAKGFNINIMGTGLFEAKSIIIAVSVFLMLLKTRIHPIFMIIGAGILGMLVF